MLGLPSRTEISKPIYKKDLLLRFNGTPAQKQKFIDEIENIKISNELSERSLSIPAGNNIKGIFVIKVQIKRQDISQSTIEELFDLIKQKIIIIFSFGEYIKLAIKESKIFLSNWKDSGYLLPIEGYNLDEVWKSYVERIGNLTVSTEQSLEESISKAIDAEKLEMEIQTLEKKMRNTKTPSKRFEIYNQILSLKKKKERIL